MSSNSSFIPKPPKVATLSRRVVLAIIFIFSGAAALFLYFLIHYSPKPVEFKVREVVSNNVEEPTTEVINEIVRSESKPLAISLEKPLKKGGKIFPHQMITEATSLPVSEFKQGSNSSISVFHSQESQVASSAAGSTSAYLPSNSTQGPYQPTIGTTGEYPTQNAQKQKTAFLKKAQDKSPPVIHSAIDKPLSQFELKAGSIIPATLVTGIQSDLPGTIMAKVSRNIFDTVSGNYLLIPQGTTVIGVYDSKVSYGQSRVLIAWSRLIFPNGESFDLEGQPGVDLAGMAGISDLVNHHYLRLFGSSLMFSLFSAAGQLSQPSGNNDEYTPQQIIYGAIGQQVSQTGAQLIAKNLNIQPSIKIRSGANFNVLLTRDMALERPYHFQS